MCCRRFVPNTLQELQQHHISKETGSCHIVLLLPCILNKLIKSPFGVGGEQFCLTLEKFNPQPLGSFYLYNA